MRGLQADSDRLTVAIGSSSGIALRSPMNIKSAIKVFVMMTAIVNLCRKRLRDAAFMWL